MGKNTNFYLKKQLRKMGKRRCYICARDLLTNSELEEILSETKYYQSWETISRLFTLDHVTPLSEGGAHSLENVRPACARCHYYKDNPVSGTNGWKPWVFNMLTKSIKKQLVERNLMEEELLKYRRRKRSRRS